MSPAAVRRDVAAQHHAVRAVRWLNGRAEPPTGVTCTPVERLPLLIDMNRAVIIDPQTEKVISHSGT